MRGVEERRGEERIYAVSELPPVRLLWSGSAGTGREIRLARLAGPALLSPGTANGVVWQRETRWRGSQGAIGGRRNLGVEGCFGGQRGGCTVLSLRSANLDSGRNFLWFIQRELLHLYKLEPAKM